MRSRKNDHNKQKHTQIPPRQKRKVPPPISTRKKKSTPIISTEHRY